MRYIEVATQAALDKALAEKKPDEVIICRGSGLFVVTDSAQVEASDSAQVEASGSAQVKAYASAQVRAYASAQVKAYASAQVRAYASAQVRAHDSAQVKAYDSAQVKASGSAQVRAYDSAQVEASQYVAVTRMSKRAKVTGGVVIELPRIDSPQAWLDYHGVEAKRGVVTLYKAVDDEWHTRGGYRLPDGTHCSYAPGTKPKAADFDPAPRDCGRGLHGCAQPFVAERYVSFTPAHYVAIPVRVKDLGRPDPDGDTDKIRFRCAAKPVYEVDIDGNPVTP
jgi:hypothetical protein